MNRRLRIVFSILLLLCLSRTGVCDVRLMSKQTDAYFSTVSMLFLYEDDEHADRFAGTWSQVKSILSEIEAAVSLSNPDSDVARFNSLPCGARMPVCTITAEILSIAFDAHEATGGLYDPTVFPLVDLWGFSPRFNRNTYSPVMPYDRAYEGGLLPLPEAAHIDALLPLVGLSGLSLTQEEGVWYLQKNTPSVLIDGVRLEAQLDLGGIAKGYACDQVMAFLRAQGYTMGHFVCGGSSMAILARPTEDGLADLTLGKPRPGSDDRITHYAGVRVRDVTLSTSSDASHAYIHDGIRYCHIIDPRTGWPVNTPSVGAQRGAASVTLLSGSAARSDAITTALFLMTPQEAAAYMSAHLRDDIAVTALYAASSDTLEVVSNAAPGVLSLDDPAYVLSSAVDDEGVVHYTGSFFSTDPNSTGRFP